MKMRTWRCPFCEVAQWECKCGKNCGFGVFKP